MAKSDCDKCLHYDQRRGALDDSPCLIARCPLVIRDEALEEAAKEAEAYGCINAEVDDPWSCGEEIAERIRAMKGER